MDKETKKEFQEIYMILASLAGAISVTLPNAALSMSNRVNDAEERLERGNDD